MGSDNDGEVPHHDGAGSDDGADPENGVHKMECGLTMRIVPAELQVHPILSLRPTQLTVGKHQVAIKGARIAAKGLPDRPKKLDKWLRKRPIPVVLGPPGPAAGGDGAAAATPAMYLIDHHHLASALLEHSITRCYCQVVGDWRDLGWMAFWRAMHDKGYVWLYDPRGQPLSLEAFVAALPLNVQGLNDDPYRSLAAMVRRAGGYDKVWVPFSEFRWANWLRHHVPQERMAKLDDPACLTAAVALARSPSASDLPGFISQEQGQRG